MQGPQIGFLPDGRRMHLHHGPIDMIVDVTGPGRAIALRRAATRFETVLDELVRDLPRLRQPNGDMPATPPARRMVTATAPFAPTFITPMAAVAGAGADTILEAICDGEGVTKAYVNNGGDIAFHLTGKQTVTAAVAAYPPATVTVVAHDATRGIATSGWRGRSHSLGIADSVTVLARNAAAADAAATLIANKVDLPDHAAITRVPATDHAPDSDLGARLVTTAVGPLDPSDIAAALAAGASYAQTLCDRGLIHAAYISLQGATRVVGHLSLSQQKVPEHA
ncbi:UPF0280 family protein [Roseovarius rhodophyticola]|uniref:UPF0280 family protein n=1 Tax=Roseovarius rhodophyticola TaxID=3080827 RepID=A0ABZ2TI03_9RHOB|nr:UPF0280 family protein [Roseovarius sp. W115]MDV2929627.1 UPF0280 family protein [Roseovarius sp. W115]